MSPLRRPVGAVAQLASAALAVVALLPVLLRLPRVAVIACFESGHPLYTLTAQRAPFDCVAAPGPVIGWVLMVAGAVLIHLLVLPVLAAGIGLLARGLLGVIAAMRRTLVLAFGVPALPVLLSVRLDADREPAYAVADVPHRTNPRRGPPSLD